MEGCVFCKIVAGEIPSEKKYEDGDIVAFNDIKPAAPVHVLIVPKKHIENISNLKEGDTGVVGKCQFVAKKLAEELGITDAFRLSTLNGHKAGQRVFHLHYHLMGGWEDGKFPPLG